jgi:phosphoglucosamine mutase
LIVAVAPRIITPFLLEKMGCEVARINCYPDTSPPRGAEPFEANLGHLMRATRELSADLGIAHDIDADRMMVIDDRGQFIPGDKLLAIFARVLGFKEIVTTIDASMLIDEIGLQVYRTRVGDVYVSRELKERGSFGGEPSGSWIFPWLSFCPDGIAAAAQVAAIASRYPLSELVDALPQYPIIRGSTSIDGVSMSELEEALRDKISFSLCKTDGLKFNCDDGWILVRRSGTEPKIRVTIEVKNEQKLRQLYNLTIQCIETCRQHGLKDDEYRPAGGIFR